MYTDQSPLGPDVPVDVLIYEPVDIDEFLERMSNQLVPPRRRLGRAGGRVPTARRANCDDREPKAPPRIELVLYTSPASEKSRRALRAVQEILKRYDASQVKLTTCDLSLNPQDGDADSVLFTPTLVKQGPGPRTSIIGNLEHEEVLCDLLDASGVDRRWDD
jgi:hypothetical protein